MNLDAILGPANYAPWLLDAMSNSLQHKPIAIPTSYRLQSIGFTEAEAAALLKWLHGPSLAKAKRVTRAQMREALEKRIAEHLKEIARMELWLERNADKTP